MSRARATMAAEVGGLALIAAGAFLVETWVGLVVAGLLVVFAAALLELGS